MTGPAKRRRRMVRIQGPSDYERLDALVQRLCAELGFRLDVTGWTRKTYDVYAPTVQGHLGDLLVRVESFATTSGEVVVFDDRGMPLAEALAAALERDFGVTEASIVRR